MATTQELETLIVRLVGDDSKYTRMLKHAEKQTDRSTKKISRSWKTTMDGISSSMMKAGASLLVGVTAPATGMVKAFANFDDAMTKSTAIMGTMTASMRKDMEETAKAVAYNSTTSAKAAAEAYYFLASAGLDAAQSIAALPVVEKFAIAGAFDMAQATDLLTDAQSALGLTVDDTMDNMNNMRIVGDVLVKANTLANASVQQFSEALTNEAGAAIKQYNLDLTEGVAILATYADQGLKGNVAGSMMARMTRLLIKSINDNGEAFRSMNIDVEEFATTGKNITGVIDGISKAVDGMGPAQKAAALESLGFQARIQQAILPLLGAADGIRSYQNELEKAGGVTQRVANKQLLSFSSQMKIVWNRIMAVSIAIGERLAPYVQMIGNMISKVTNYWKGLNSATKDTIAMLIGIAAVMGPVLVSLGAMIKLTVMVSTAFVFLAKVIAIPFAIFLAKAAAVVGLLYAIGKGVEWVVDTIWGPGSFAAALEYTMGVAKQWADTIIGFLSNLKHNFFVLVEWIPANWGNMFDDMLNLGMSFAKNMFANFKVLMMTLLQLTGYAWKQISAGLEWLFSKEFIRWAWEGIKQVGQAIMDFAKNAYETLKSIFTGTDEAGLGQSVRKATEAIAVGFAEGMQAKSMGDIIEKQIAKMKGPLDGFKSSIEEPPKFKTNVDLEPIKKMATDVKKAFGMEGLEVKLPDVPKIPDGFELPTQDLTGGTAAVGETGISSREVKQATIISTNMSLASLNRGREDFANPKEPIELAKKNNSLVAQQVEESKKTNDLLAKNVEATEEIDTSPRAV